MLTARRTQYDYDGNPIGDADEVPVMRVTVYARTRHCGGPAEGGDWYNRIDPAGCSIPLIEPGSEKEVEEVRAFLTPRFPNEGNIYSVLGGVEYEFIAEVNEGDNTSAPYRGYE
jgi:hypothetical protein